MPMFSTEYKSKKVLILLDASSNVVVPVASINESVNANPVLTGEDWQKKTSINHFKAEKTLNLQFITTSNADAISLKDFFTSTIEGRLTGFWSPLWVQKWNPVTNGTSTTSLKVARGNRSNYLTAAARHLVIWENNFSDTPQFAEVNSIAQAGFETLTLDASVTYNRKSFIFGLYFVRFGSDTFTIEFNGGDTYIIKLSFKELQNETPT